MESAIALPWEVWAVAAAAILAAGITQGALGFGFPTVSTPVLVLATDVKTAIILNLLPNFTVNVISVVRGGNWRASLGRHWPVALYVLAGSY
ncbi:MAG: sulfite exporter TauE/SafE family protein, partial [Dehalococcoidia bacterium]|nr:sulfite exporter TauE/SafE family protein [Dehalococcoidia bacterium]